MSQTIAFDVIAHWLRIGRCNTTANTLNIKQTAYLLLVGACLQATLNLLWGLPQADIPFKTFCFSEALAPARPSFPTWPPSFCTSSSQTPASALLSHIARLAPSQSKHSILAWKMLFALFGKTSTPCLSTKLPCSQMNYQLHGTSGLPSPQRFSNPLGWPCPAIVWRFPSTASSCSHLPHQPFGFLDIVAAVPPQTPSECQVAQGHSLWSQISTTIILDDSHRCHGPLRQLLEDLAFDNGMSDQSWRHLQDRVLHT